MTMSDVRTRRISRELALAAAGASLGTLEPWVTDRLTAMLEEEEVAAGDRIFGAGEPPDHFFVVREGRVELVRNGQSAEMVEGPRALGVLDALAERLRSHSAYARMPLQLLRVRMDAWLELLEDSFDLARMSVIGLARVVAGLEERLWATGRQLEAPAPPFLETPRAQLDIVERLAMLMHAPPLRGAGVQPLSDLATASEEIVFGAGEAIFQRGVLPDRLFVLIDGRAEASRESPKVTWRGGPAQLVCGVASLGEQRLPWEARAVTRTRALSFGVEDWFDLMEENFEMVRATLTSLAIEHERLLGEV